MEVGFKINLDTHHINHANSNLTITPNYPDLGIEVRYITKIIKELSITYARLKNQHKLKYQTIFSARFDKQDEENQVLDETDSFITSNNNHNLTETDLIKLTLKIHYNIEFFNRRCKFLDEELIRLVQWQFISIKQV